MVTTIRILLAGMIVALIGATHFSCNSPTTTTPLYSDVGRACDEARRAFPDHRIPSWSTFRSVFDKAVLEVSRDLDTAKSASDTVDALIRQVYHRWGIGFDTARDSLAAIFPHAVVRRQSGSCLGVSLLFLLIGERLDLPVHGVMPPTHFFVRFDNGVERINIEPNRTGFRYHDEEYRKKYGIVDSTYYDLRNLTSQEVLGVLYYNLGNVQRQRGRGDAAVAAYRTAVQRFAVLAEAWGNLGIALDAQGRRQEAVDALVKARELNPLLPNIDRNLEALRLRAGDSGAVKQ